MGQKGRRGRGREVGEVRAPKLLLNQDPSERYYASAERPYHKLMLVLLVVAHFT